MNNASLGIGRLIVRGAFLAMVCAGVARSTTPESGDARPATAVKSANALESRFWPTAWQEGPTRQRPDIVFPQSIGAEVVATPEGRRREPLPKEEYAPPAGEGAPGVPIPPTDPPGPFGLGPDFGEGLPSLDATPPAPSPEKRSEKETPSQDEGLPLVLPPTSLRHVAPVFRHAAMSSRVSSRGENPVKTVSHEETEPSTGEKETPTRENSGLLTVHVPYAAKVFINGRPTAARGSCRRFVSHDLKPGLVYKYEVRAELVRHGRLAEETKTLYLTAGDLEGVAFGFNREPLAGP
ncbi:MAG: TIGR03000 domain-containing protein [Pirellulales bacterium]|nr:TIGR03000 domain-containing protein [Pirellulales bacterium]